MNCVSIKLADFLGSIISPKLKGTNYSAWLIQKDGLVLYDPDPSQVGKMLSMIQFISHIHSF